MNTIDELRSFIDKAQKSRKYVPNVATNYKTPLKWIEAELTEEEKNSMDVFKKNIDQIFNLFYSKPNNKLSAASIEVYKKRTKNLLSDFERYGKDAAAMAGWNRPIITRRHKVKPEVDGSKSMQNETIPPNQPESKFGFTDLSISGIRLLIPKNDKVDDAIAAGELKEARDKLNEFAKKVGLTSTEEKTDAGGSGRVASPSTNPVD